MKNLQMYESHICKKSISYKNLCIIHSSQISKYTFKEEIQNV